MELTFCVATYGSSQWREWGDEAADSIRSQASVIRHHGHGTLAEARNHCLSQVSTSYVSFVDGDDTVEPGYACRLLAGSADVRVPAVRWMPRGAPVGRHIARIPSVHAHRQLHPRCSADCIKAGNWVVVGAAVRTDLLRQIGGWRERPCIEDWEVWLRCYKAGATFEAIPDAVYRAYRRPGSRNHMYPVAYRNRVHRAILREVQP